MKIAAHLRMEETKLPPGQEWTDAAAVWRFMQVREGSAYWLGDARPRALAEGELLILAPAVRGLIHASQLNPVVLRGFFFAPDLLCGFFTLAERHFFETNAARPSPARFVPSTHPVAQAFTEIARRFEPQTLSGRAAALGIVAALFDEEIAGHRVPESGGTSALHRFQQLIARMPDLEMINHTPEHLAELCGCSPRHFNRLFRNHFGTSTRARQTELRLLKASQLLGGTAEKIVQVASDSGYRNLSLFNALFKKRFGMTPTEWRQKTSTAPPVAP